MFRRKCFIFHARGIVHHNTSVTISYLLCCCYYAILLFCVGSVYRAYCKVFAHGRAWSRSVVVNTLRPRRNGRHFADDIFKGILLNENIWIPIKMSLTFVPKSPINHTPVLVPIMAWRRSGDKPLSGPMAVSLLAHICITRPQWVKNRPIVPITCMIISLSLGPTKYCHCASETTERNMGKKSTESTSASKTRQNIKHKTTA